MGPFPDDTVGVGPGDGTAVTPARVDLFFQLVDHVFLFDLPVDLSVDVDQSLAVTGGDSDVRSTRSGAVRYDAVGTRRGPFECEPRRPPAIESGPLD